MKITNAQMQVEPAMIDRPFDYAQGRLRWNRRQTISVQSTTNGGT
jgi:hypothetical protein